MTILAAVDGEQTPSRTVEVGHELARQFDAEFVVIHVMPQDTFDEIKNTMTGSESPVFLAPGISYVDQANQSRGSSNDGSRYSIQNGEKSAANVARDVVAETLDEWNDVTVQGRVGEPVTEILSEANRRGARYLVIGGRKRTPVGKAVFGSITQSILLNADLPVVTVMREE